MSKARAEPVNPRVRALVSEHGGAMRDPEKILVALIQRAIRRTKFSSPPPPYDPVAIASAVGCAVELDPNVLSDAALQTAPDGRFVISVSPSLSVPHRNFAIAHELMHVFFARAFRSVRQYVTPKDVQLIAASMWEEERLCERGAAQLLMPRRAFVGEAMNREPSWPMFAALSKVFVASIESVVVRYGSLFPDGTYLVERWRVMDGRLERNTLACSRNLNDFARRKSVGALRVSGEEALLAFRGEPTAVDLWVSGRRNTFWIQPFRVRRSAGAASSLVLIRPIVGSADSSPS